MHTTKKLTKEVVKQHIRLFTERYNQGDYVTACEFYADEVLYYDGTSTSQKSRADVLVDIEKEASEIFGSNPIALKHLKIHVSLDGRSANVLMRFTIGSNEFSAQMAVKFIDGRPQVTYDQTIAI